MEAEKIIQNLALERCLNINSKGSRNFDSVSQKIRSLEVPAELFMTGCHQMKAFQQKICVQRGQKILQYFIFD